MQIRTLLQGACCLALFAVRGHAATLSNADKQFMIMAAKTDMTEAHIGQMAENQANRPEVKDLAKALVQDHTESYARLVDLAGRTGVSIPKGINTGKDPAIQLLGHLKGASFDRTFERDEIASHRRALEIFKREAANAQDPDVKAYATSKIPVLQKHLHLAEECAKPAKRS
jgi:putative membrane protein